MQRLQEAACVYSYNNEKGKNENKNNFLAIFGKKRITVWGMKIEIEYIALSISRVVFCTLCFAQLIGNMETIEGICATLNIPAAGLSSGCRDPSGEASR